MSLVAERDKYHRQAQDLEYDLARARSELARYVTTMYASDMSKPKKNRSGTSRSYEDRLAGGRPNVTFSLPVAAVDALARLADHYKLSRSAVVALAISELEKKIR